MRQFLFKLLLFVFLGYFLLNWLICPIFINNRRLNMFHGKWPSQAYANNKSRSKIKPDYIILGDSVTNQLYNALKHPASFATNGASLVAGQYILAMNIYKHNPHIKAIFLLHPPLILNYPFERRKTYRNLILPFFTFKNKKYFTDTILTYMNQKPLSYLAIIPYFKISNLVSDIRFKRTSTERGKRLLLRPYAIEYYRRLIEFSKKTGVLVKVILLPLKKANKKKYGFIFTLMDKQIKEEGLGDLFGDFGQQIRYVDDDLFFDFIHFKPQFIPQFRRQYDEIISIELSRIGVKF